MIKKYSEKNPSARLICELDECQNLFMTGSDPRDIPETLAALNNATNDLAKYNVLFIRTQPH